MLLRLSKTSLLAGASVAVLVMGSSGGLAQTAPNFQSGTDDIWADGATRNAGQTSKTVGGVTSGITDIAEARSGDNLELTNNTVTVDNTSKNTVIGVLKSGTTGAGSLKIESKTGSTVFVNIGQIQKQGGAAVDLLVDGGNNSGALLGASISGEATVNNLTIDMSGTTAANGGASVTGTPAGARVTFAQDLTTEGATLIRAGQNATTPIDATLVLRGDVDLGGDITLDDGANPQDGRATLIISGGSFQLIDGGVGGRKIAGSADGEGTLKILNGNEGGAPHEAAFGNVQIGSSPTNRLGLLIVGDRNKGGRAVFQENAYVDRINVYAGDQAAENGIARFGADVDSDQITLNGGNATIRFSGRSTQNVGGNIGNGGNNGAGLLDINNSGTGADNRVIFVGRVGVSADEDLRKITLTRGVAEFRGNVFVQNIEATSAAEFKGDVTTEGVEFKAAGAKITLNGAGNQNVTGDITADGDNRGELVVDNTGAAGSNRVTFVNNVGQSTTRDLGKITLNDGIAQFNGDVFVQNIDATSVAEFKGDVTTEELEFKAAGAQITLNGSDNQTFTGDITAGGNDRGELVVDNAGAAGSNRVTFVNNVGQSLFRDLGKITLGRGIAQFNGNVSAKNIDATSAAEFRGNVTTEGLVFRADDAKITLNGSNNQIFSGGDITADGDNRGELVVDNTGAAGSNRVIFAGNIGAANRKLREITLNRGLAEFRGNIFANRIDINSADGAEFKGNTTAVLNLGGSSGSVVFNGTAAQNIAGQITTGENNSGKIKVTNSVGVTFGRQIGAGRTDPNDASTARQLREISVGDGSDAGKATFVGDVFARVLKISGGDAAGEDSEVTIQNNLSGNVELADNTGSAKFIVGGIPNRRVSRNIDGNITVANNDEGVVEIEMTSGTLGAEQVTFKGQIGAQGQALGKLDVRTPGQGLRFEGDVYANDITVDNDTALNPNETGGSFVVFERNVVSNERIILKRTTIFKGDVTANKTGASEGFRFDPSTRQSKRPLNTIDPTAVFSGTDAQTFTGEITTGLAGEGRIDVRNTRGVTFKNDVGTSAAKLDNLTLGNTTKATFEGSVHFANESNIGNGAMLTFGGAGRPTDTTAGAQEISGDFGGQGTIVVDNRGDGGAGRVDNNKVTFKNAIGVAAVLNTLTLDNGLTTFDGNVNVTTLNVNSGDGTTFKGNLAGALNFGGDDIEVTFGGTGNQTFSGTLVTGNNDNRGVFIVNSGGRVTFDNDLGSSAVRDLKQITLERGTAQFDGNVFVQNIEATSAAEFKGDVTTGGLEFKADDARITLNGSDNQTFRGNITADGQNRGELVVNNVGTTNKTVTFAGGVGDTTNRIAGITVQNGSAVFQRNVFSNVIDIDAGSDGTTFDQSVTFGTDLKLAGAAIFKGNVTRAAGVTGGVGIRFDGATGSATFNGTTAQTVTGNITTSTGNNYGAITVENSAGVTFAGQLGATGNGRLKSVTLSGNATAAQAAKATFKGAVYLNEDLALGQNTESTFAQKVDVNRDVTLGNNTQTTFNGAVRVSRNVTLGNDSRTTFAQAVDVDGNLVLNTDAEASFAQNVDVNRDVTLGNNAQTTFGGAVRVGGNVALGNDSRTTFARAVDVDGNLALGTGAGASFAQAVDVDGNLTLNSNANTTFGQAVNIGGNFAVGNNATITLGDAFGARTGAAANNAFITIGSQLTGLDATNRVRISLSDNVGLGMQKLVSVTVTDAQRNNVIFTGQNDHIKHLLRTDGVLESKIAIGADTATEYGVSRDQGHVVEQAWEALKSDPALMASLKRMGGETAAGQRKFAQQVFPQTSVISGATAVTLGVGTQVAGVFSDRLSALRGSGARTSGFATGGEGMDKSFWLKPFGGWGRQSNDGTFSGYTTQSYGLATGFDGSVGEKSRLGVAVAYSASNIKGKGAGQDKTAVKNGLLSVYGGYTGNNYYVEGSLGYGRNDIETDSRVLAMKRKASYDTNLLTASVGGGIPVSVRGGGFVTPTVGVSWSRVGAASYTTTGASKLNQKIAVRSIDAIVGSVGAKVHKRIKKARGTFVPSARLGVSYDFAGERTTVKGNFTGGGKAFNVKGAKSNQFAGTAGLGLSFEGRKWSVGADYDLDTRSGYTGHAARLNAKLKF